MTPSILEGARAQARMWGKMARTWRGELQLAQEDGDTAKAARCRFCAARCADQARKWARYTVA